jgi:hypothetical protein
MLIYGQVLTAISWNMVKIYSDKLLCRTPGIFLGGKDRHARRADNFPAICEPTVYKMWEPRPLTFVWPSTTCYRDSFTFYAVLMKIKEYHCVNFVLCQKPKSGSRSSWSQSCTCPCVVSVSPAALKPVGKSYFFLNPKCLLCTQLWRKFFIFISGLSDIWIKNNRIIEDLLYVLQLCREERQLDCANDTE